MPVFLTKLHAERPPRWVTFTGREITSITGLEPHEYMADNSNHEVLSVDVFLDRFPWVGAFLDCTTPGQTALFTDAPGEFVIEED